MIGDGELVKIIRQLKSENPIEVTTARNELVQLGKRSISNLIGFIINKYVPVEEIMKTLSEMSEENAIEAYSSIIRSQDMMPPDVVIEAQSMLQAFGIDPNDILEAKREREREREKERRKTVESIEMEIHPTCISCKMNLVHMDNTKSHYSDVHIIQRNTDNKIVDEFRGGNVKKEAVQEVITKFETQGFSRIEKSIIRRYEYLTYARRDISETRF